MRLVSTPWAQIVPDSIGGFGVLVAAGAAWLSQRASRQSNDVSRRVAAIEAARWRSERVPRLTAQLDCWGPGSTGFRLSVWLESSEPLLRLRVVLREARNVDCPVGFTIGQNGVANELPEEPGLQGILPAWESDTLRPIADWDERIAPGNAAIWAMELRRSAHASAGADGIRLKVLAWAEVDDETWEQPLSVTLTDRARIAVDEAAGGVENSSSPLPR